MGQQTTYTQSPPIGTNGQLASSRQDNVKLARAAEGTVNFGTLVERGTADNQVAAPSGAITSFVGIVVNSFDTDQDLYNDGAMINVLRSGHIYVTCANAFAAGGDVFATNVGGAIRADVTGATQIPNAVFQTSGGAGEIAEIEIDLVGQG